MPSETDKDCQWLGTALLTIVPDAHGQASERPRAGSPGDERG
ncbi:hypothetical protein STXM2123_750 [Streptomyces sp. F-3]|nr:hypothetical protein STXM2123_750 [Streptomyces sp. F-3]